MIRRHPVLALLSAGLVLAMAALAYLVDEVVAYPHRIDR